MELPPFLAAAFYKNQLVILPENQVAVSENPLPAVETKKVPEKAYLGDNKKKITILHTEPAAAFLTDEQFKLMSGILTACKISMADIALVNLAHQKINFQEIKQQLQPQFVILFDVSPTSIELPFTIPPYQIQDYNNCKILVAGSLQYMTLETDEVKKQKTLLWNALRKMFSL
ncbi:MAG: hypothetical protein FGM61_08030 [Sediminibacterium sp.]|nr:hypothetical protein [Sediminibacterium sp.]